MTNLAQPTESILWFLKCLTCICGRLLNISAELHFINFFPFFVFQSTEFSETPSPDSDSVNSVEGHSEPSWFKDIKFDDSDTEQIADEGEDNSASKFHLSLVLTLPSPPLSSVLQDLAV